MERAVKLYPLWLTTFVILIIAASIFQPSTNSSYAQEAAQITDTELRAAYCLGITTGQMEADSAELKGYQTEIKAGRGTTAIISKKWQSKLR